MATTAAELCNLALAKIGEKQFIDSLSSNTTAAKTCNVIFDSSLRAVLEEMPWPFATRRADLAELTITRSGWAYVYARPTDCLPGGERYIWSGIRNPAREQQIPFELEDDADEGAILLTDQRDAELVYTRSGVEVAKMTPLFQEALSWKLAYELTFAIPIKSQLGLSMANGYAGALARAGASAFRHLSPSPPPKPAAVRAR